ncbi:GatB/YqeY domain-containing protein [Iamia sp. SCSIO 61187]|uniref:GatB/YqeY domain-containing protein n=1 Tax=Iamia sp. SCSIO 61187 TaxID=2722752 RepID=UPI001C62AB94|nr:GatB/YqeY domain-containing protein [Iamia sp. SCSIO 61187]QYG94516.1 GatB/YqeY domain-containing protein [Iamia sp. SCSIO 61187]
MLAERIQSDLTASMKARDQLTTTVLRSVLAAVKEARVAEGAADELTDADVEAVVKREAKKRDEAAAAFADAGREEQAAKERAEGEILARNLPAPLTDAELEELVTRVLQAGGFSSPTDMGPAMKAVQAEVAGRRDGKAVSALVKARLTGG